MKKNILAENLLRFGVKNLSESDVTRLTEADPAINEVKRELDMMINHMNNMVKRYKSNPENSWNTNQNLINKTFTWKRPTRIDTAQEGQYYDLYLGDKLIGKMLLPYLKDINSQVYENYFVNAIKSVMNNIRTNLTSLFGRDTAAATSVRGVLGNTIKELAGKFKAAYDAAEKKFNASQKAQGTQAPE